MVSKREWFDNHIRETLDLFVLHIIGTDDDEIYSFINEKVPVEWANRPIVRGFVSYYKETSDIYIMESL